MRFLLLHLVAVILIALIDEASSREFELKFKKETDCDAASEIKGDKTNGKTYVGNKKYRVLDAYIYWTDKYGKVLGYAVCNVPGSTKCVGEKTYPDGASKRYLVLVVTLVKTSFEDQNIHYQYFDELFGLSKLEDPRNYDSASHSIHNLNNFLFPHSAVYSGKTTLRFSANNCRKNRAKSLISGHGYFITEFGKDDAVWENLYYLPHRIGQYITIPK